MRSLGGELLRLSAQLPTRHRRRKLPESGLAVAIEQGKRLRGFQIDNQCVAVNGLHRQFAWFSAFQNANDLRDALQSVTSCGEKRHPLESRLLSFLKLPGRTS